MTHLTQTKPGNLWGPISVKVGVSLLTQTCLWDFGDFSRSPSTFPQPEDIPGARLGKWRKLGRHSQAQRGPILANNSWGSQNKAPKALKEHITLCPVPSMGRTQVTGFT